MSTDRTFTIPALYIGEADATLSVESSDGETATMTLTIAGRLIAEREGFRRPEIGPHTWWNAPESDVVGTFAAFFDHAVNSGEDGAQDGWMLEDSANGWTDALTIYAAELEDENV
jgi:hypothetical protein